MIFRPNANLSDSFDRLKAAFREADRIWKDEKSEPLASKRLASAHASLLTDVEFILVEVEQPYGVPPVPITKTSPS